MTYLITFLDNNVKSTVSTGGNIRVLYSYQYYIGDPTTMTTSGQRSHNFGPSYFIKNYTESLQPVIAALHMRQKIICECCGIIGHKSDTYIIHGPKLLSPSHKGKMNKSKSLHGKQPNEPPREWNSQPPEAHLRSSTSTIKTSHMASEVMGRLNHNAIDNGYVEVYPSKFSVEFNSESFTDPDTTLIKSIDDD